MLQIEGVFLCFLTWVLLAFADLVLSFNCIYTWLTSPSFLIHLSSTGFTLFLILQTTVLLTFISHLRCSFSDPGKTPKLQAPSIPLEEIGYCEICDQYKPPRSHHCRKCNTCVHRMDHHCIWTNNCIGFKNHKYFILFLFYAFISSVIGLFIIVYCGIIFINRVSDFVYWKVFLVLIVGFECLLFGIFAADFLKEQFSLIKENQTLIEKFNRKYGEDLGGFENFKTLMGPPWLWLLPISSTPTNYLEPLLTYSQKILERTKRLRYSSNLHPLAP